MRKTLLLGATVLLIAAGPANRDAQTWLAQVATDYAARYAAAPNDMAKGLIRHQRAAAVCDPKGPLWLGKGQVRDWSGVVAELDAVSDGRGILGVKVSPIVTLHTTNNSFSEQVSDTKTLIPVGSPIYNVATGLAVGQHVRFSGTFFASPDDCVKETSLTPQGAMTEPEYLFRFTELTPTE